MKKKKFIVSITVLVLSLFTFTAVFAYVGVEGTVTDGGESSQPWVNGGTVTAYGNDGGYKACGSDTIAADGTYSIFFSCSPDDFSDIYLVFTFDDSGGGGTPSTQTEILLQIPQAITATVNIQTDTGPTAVVLTDFAPAEFSAGWIPLAVVGLLALVSGALTLARRRSWS